MTNQQPSPSAAAAVNPDPHAELRKTWQPGQRWQARSFRNGQWGPWTDAVASEPFWFPHQDYRRHPDDLAPQPSTTAQAASSAVLKAIREANMQLVRTGDDEFMLVTYKNAKAQCDGGECGIGGYCDDCPAPQADSQPAPVRDYPPLPEQVAWRDSVEHCDLYWRPAVQAQNDLEPLFTKQQMRAYVDADRATRAPADSGAAPAVGGVAGPSKWTVEEIADGKRGIRWVTEGVIHGRPTDHDVREYLMRTPAMRGCLCDECKTFYAPTPPAQAADSVLEDAARYRWLRQEHERVDPVCHLTWKRNLQRDSSEWVNTAVLDTAIDKARKQGGQHG